MIVGLCVVNWLLINFSWKWHSTKHH